jgi:hypothetical protein
MALAATGMTAGTMFLTRRSNVSMNKVGRSTGSGIDHRFKGCQGGMQAVLRRGGNLLVAVATDRLCINQGGIFDETLVGRLPVGIGGIAPVAVHTVNCPVFGFQKGWVDVYFFIQLQRSQRAASAFTAGFGGGFRFRPDFFHFPAQPDQLFEVGVALHAMVKILTGLPVKVRRENPPNPNQAKSAKQDGVHRFHGMHDSLNRLWMDLCRAEGGWVCFYER